MRAVRIAVLMPAFNEAGRLAATLDELRSLGAGAAITVFLVDDGSEPPIDASTLEGGPTSAWGDRDREKVGVVLARHAVNLGQGAALETARRLALDPRFAPPSGFDAYVTMDADGQHRGADVLALAE